MNKNLPDMSDIIALLGLTILGTGIWMISPAWSLITVGGIIFIIGVARSRG